MSAHRCIHGIVVADNVGTYRCYRCEPLEPADLEREFQASEAAVDEALQERDARIAELERVVAQLAERAGITFTPPPGSE